jgi:predicted DCC family thiol-disulfide oxidoreductase YuxK
LSSQPPGCIRTPAFYFAPADNERDVEGVNATPSPAAAGPVLFFDGDCGLCNRLVRALLRLDRAGRLRFAPLQGPAAQAYLRAHGLPTQDFDTLIFVPDWSRRDRPEYLVRTKGALAALAETGHFGRAAAGLLALVPTPLRDQVYRWIGRWRFRLFGPWKPRPLRRPEFAARFLDNVENAIPF